MQEDSETKICKQCGIEKSLSAFSKYSPPYSGTYPRCIACYNANAKLRQLGLLPKRGTIEERFWAKVSKSDGDGCWEWLGGLTGGGYGIFGRQGMSHRFSWELHNGPIPENMQVCHHCDNRKCVRPDHLFLGTPKDNMQDCKAKGRLADPNTRARGEQAGSAKLTDATVRIIRERYKTGTVTLAQLAEEYGVSSSAIHLALIRHTWAHVSDSGTA